MDNLARLVEVMRRLRAECPWDAEQTHRSLVRYLVEEACELVEAIETGDDADLKEELGDLLLQVVFHAEIARGEGRFDIDDVAAGIADKLVARHPHVFDDAEVPADLRSWWEQRKAVEKGRDSALEGIPQQLSALTRSLKVIGRARRHQVIPLAEPEPVLQGRPETVGADLLAIVGLAEAAGIDPEQALRDALRQLESEIVAREAEGPQSADHR